MKRTSESLLLVRDGHGVADNILAGSDAVLELDVNPAEACMRQPEGSNCGCWS